MAAPLIEQGLAELIQSFGLVDGAALAPLYFWGFEPPEPAFAVTVLAEPGATPLRRLGEFPGVAVIVRHLDGQEANRFQRAIYGRLQDFQGRLIVGGEPIPVARVSALTSAPIQFGHDAVGPGPGRWRCSRSYQLVTRMY